MHRRAPRPVHRGVAVVACLALLAVLGAAPVRAADPTFGTPTIDAKFGQGIELTQPVTLPTTPFRVELLLTSGDDGVPLVTEVPPPTSPGAATLRYTLDVREGHILPNTPVVARWRITTEAGAPPVLGPEVRTVFDDDRYAWQTVEGDVVRVHWYEGSRQFAERALAIGEEAVAKTAALLGVTEDQPIDFFIYADQGAFYDALGPGTRENVGGQANADIRTLFALIRPSEIDDPWVGIVVPHELVHLVFDTAVGNPYHFPPRWLNEGLAVYLSQGYDASDRSSVESAGRKGELIPLDGLAGQFPTTADGFFLAYAESVSAVDFFIRTHGQEALLKVIASYADGRTDDEAFQAAIGLDVAAFNAAWLADLGAEVPIRYGPQPAPPGPQPAGWGGGVVGGPAPTGGAGVGAPGPSPSAGDGTGASSGGTVDTSRSLPVLVAATGLVGAAVIVLLLVRRRRPPAATP
ncbi:MAG: peptidase MA family metallohydrolase [Candidatus Limnocylindrales bacterium]